MVLRAPGRAAMCYPTRLDLRTIQDCPKDWPPASRFLRALFQFSKRAAGEATEFSRSRVELLSVIGAARLECGEPAAEAGELIRRQLSNSFGDFFDFHVVQYSTAEAWLSDGKGLDARLLAERVYLLRCSGYAVHDSRRVKWYGSWHILLSRNVDRPLRREGAHN